MSEGAPPPPTAAELLPLPIITPGEDG